MILPPAFLSLVTYHCFSDRSLTARRPDAGDGVGGCRRQFEPDWKMRGIN